MNYQVVGLSNRFQYEVEEKNWKSLESYVANSSQQEQVCRVANDLVFCAAIYKVLTGGPVGWLSGAVMALASRKIVSAAIGYLAYPAAFTSFPGVSFNLKEKENKLTHSLSEQGFTVRKISVYKSGTRYDARLITHYSTIDNGRWTIHALGNGMAMEPYMGLAYRDFDCSDSNTLLINGPSVSESGGWPTRYQMGAGFEAGLQLLEREIKATHIVMWGLSLGGGMMAEAIINHDFTEGIKRNIKYLSISDRTFGKLSTIAAELIGSLVKPLFYITGTELDGVEAARKLSNLGIRQIVIQHNSKDNDGSDRVIPDKVSLSYELHQEKLFDSKVFLVSEQITHVGEFPEEIQDKLEEKITQFFNT